MGLFSIDENEQYLALESENKKLKEEINYLKEKNQLLEQQIAIKNDLNSYFFKLLKENNIINIDNNEEE